MRPHIPRLVVHSKQGLEGTPHARVHPITRIYVLIIFEVLWQVVPVEEVIPARLGAGTLRCLAPWALWRTGRLPRHLSINHLQLYLCGRCIRTVDGRHLLHRAARQCVQDKKSPAQVTQIRECGIHGCHRGLYVRKGTSGHQHVQLQVWILRIWPYMEIRSVTWHA